MFKLIKNGDVYAPHFLGKKDILIAGGKIARISDQLSIPKSFGPIDVLDGSNHYIVPGLIDGHVHITGGGGEGGYKTRTPELNLSNATLSGITTVVGVLGTDGTTRRMANLIAKARALEEEGITCFVLTGSYQVPVKTLLDTIEDDLILIDTIIGVGEIAISDHRSSSPTTEELTKIASAARIGGMLSGKSGIVNVHVGAGKDGLSSLEKVVEETDIPITQFWPTHMNRNKRLLKEGIRYGKMGGIVDLTTSSIPGRKQDGTVKASTGLKQMLEEGVEISNITFTSDGQGSLPRFDEKGRLAGLQVGKVSSLFDEFKDAVVTEQIPLETALKVVTENPAKVLKLEGKGKIQEGMDADLVMIEKKTFSVDTVLASGKRMVERGKAVIKGTFE